MSIRVCFFPGSPDGALGHFLSAPLLDFRAWYIRESTDADGLFADEVPVLTPLLDSVIEQGLVALQPQTAEQARTIDLLVDTFYLWCDWERQEVLGETLAGTLKSWKYNDAAPEIRRRYGDEAARLWDYLRTGRTIGRPETPFPYTPVEEGYPNAFWTYEEAKYLYLHLSPFWGEFANVFDEESLGAVDCAFRAVETAYKDGTGIVIVVT